MDEYPESLLAEFIVSYDGSATADHSIDANLLANSLKGISSLLEDSNREINGVNSQIDIKVKSNFIEGSFEVQLIGIMSGALVTAIVNTVDLVGLAGNLAEQTISFIDFIRMAKGKEITHVERISENEARVDIEGNNSGIIVQHSVVNLYTNLGARKSAELVVSPLKSPGIDTMDFKKNLRLNTAATPIRITKDDVEYFDVPEPETSEDQNVAELTITQSNLYGKPSGWRFSFEDTGDDDFRADILDNGFLRLVRSGYFKFTTGDYVKAQYLRTQQKKERRTNQWVIKTIIEYNGKPISKMGLTI